MRKLLKVTTKMVIPKSRTEKKRRFTKVNLEKKKGVMSKKK